MRSEIKKRGIKDPKIHVYTGDGKGKTTAAFGAGLRAAGCGFSVVVIQFLKDASTGELAAAAQVEGLTVLQLQQKAKGFYKDMDEAQKKLLAEETEAAFSRAEALMAQGSCDMLILDEIFACLSLGLISEARLLQLMAAKSAELILTGRIAPEAVLAAADYVTLMQAAKHPFDKGVSARKGVEY